MLVVRVEVWPYGAQTGKYQIAAMQIWNEGGGAVSRYGAQIVADGYAPVGLTPFEAVVAVAGHARSDGPWVLIHKILSAALAEDGPVRSPPFV